jgi:Holliday junction resolvase-like predicted endonuclease
LVCRDRGDNALVFVEVKTRRTNLFAAPRSAVNFSKRVRLIRAAKEWLRLLDNPEVCYRFDIVEVTILPTVKCSLFPAAFSVPDDVYS